MPLSQKLGSEAASPLYRGAPSLAPIPLPFSPPSHTLFSSQVRATNSCACSHCSNHTRLCVSAKRIFHPLRRDHAAFGWARTARPQAPLTAVMCFRAQPDRQNSRIWSLPDCPYWLLSSLEHVCYLSLVFLFSILFLLAAAFVHLHC